MIEEFHTGEFLAMVENSSPESSSLEKLFAPEYNLY